MEIVGVSFKENGKIYYFNKNNKDLELGNKVIVETERGLQYGVVTTKVKSVDDKEATKYQMVLRKASKEDLQEYEKNKNNAQKALEKAIKLAKDLGLEMTFIDASYTFDKNQLIFYFISDNRVDFRELAKQLAGLYKTRIELRQVGVRDKAKEVSGIGPCGRQLCCSNFLKDLDSVTIAMAKNQNLALNPSKINGLCGRLLCCLNYEDQMYAENKEYLPQIGDYVEAGNEKGNVIFVDIPNMKYKILTKENTKVEIKLQNNKCDKCEKKRTCNK